MFLTRDHPRMRGEDKCEQFVREAFGGSPPHARGRRWDVSKWRAADGITPACAGKTRCGGWSTGCGEDHPRMRGEDRSFDACSYDVPGSPPHARGRLFPLAGQCRCDGITPACAGKTGPRARVSGEPSDHPRMRGEDQNIQTIL